MRLGCIIVAFLTLAAGKAYAQAPTLEKAPWVAPNANLELACRAQIVGDIARQKLFIAQMGGGDIRFWWYDDDGTRVPVTEREFITLATEDCVSNASMPRFWLV